MTSEEKLSGHYSVKSDVSPILQVFLVHWRYYGLYTRDIMVMKVELMRLLALIKVKIFLERGHNLTARFHFQKMSLKVNRTVLFCLL